MHPNASNIVKNQLRDLKSASSSTKTSSKKASCQLKTIESTTCQLECAADIVNTQMGALESTYGLANHINPTVIKDQLITVDNTVLECYESTQHVTAR